MQDLEAVIRRVATFLKKSLTDDQVEKLRKFLSFDNLSKLEKESGMLQKAVDMGIMNDTGSFYRKG